jgi:hypothetical protein
MRCSYCGQSPDRGSEEHVPSRYLGSRLKTRKVCWDCNQRAGREIDDRLAAYLMVNMPKALADVRSIKQQGKEPVVEVDGIISATGEPAKIRFSPRRREIFRLDGSPTDEIAEIAYGMDSDLWVRFIAKVALGCTAASQLFGDDWLDSSTAVALRQLLWGGRIDESVWPRDSIPGWPGELEDTSPVRQALGDDRHLVGLLADDDDPSSSVAAAMLFGGQIYCALPLPAVAVPGSGTVWVIDWHPGPPPSAEDFDTAVERMLRERGWSTAEIDAVRLD